ncbi:uncharacterized protein [Choristoneura fumiferana]|uniref:uncharacterized protein n=1 Tax=Choristoneura fumiferana TaxID=7141 RepID=UPI003D15D236
MNKKQINQNESHDDYVDDVLIIKKIPRINKFCFCFSLRYGTFCVIFLGIVVGLSSFTAFLLLKNRPELSYSTVILLLLMTIFGVASVTFVIASLLLLVAVLANNAGLMPYYLWLTITYWISQFALGILIPLVLIFEAEYPVSVGLAWSCIVVFLGLLWTHFLATVKSYMLELQSTMEGSRVIKYADIGTA